MPVRVSNWRTPIVIVVCGCLLSLISFGPRSTFGFFLTPMTAVNGWGRDVFAFALAIEMLLWGAAQPFAGALADRFGAAWVLMGGAVLYVAGVIWMAYATTPLEFYLSAGVLIGFGLGGCSFALVIGAFAKLTPAQWRTVAFGAGTAAGSFGQFLFSPLAIAMIGQFGWQNTLLIFAAVLLTMLPLSLALAAPPRAPGAAVLHAARAKRDAGAGGSARSPQLHSARPRLFHLWLSAFLYHRAFAGLSGRSRLCPSRSAAGPSR